MNIYTDGACKDNSRKEGVAEGKGGWAFIILENKPGKDMEEYLKDYGQVIGTTNQEMEIMAVVKALEALSGKYCEIINLYSDSAYVINCLNDRWYDKWLINGWLNNKKKSVENREAWERLINVVEQRSINFFHVKRNTTKFIRLVDGLAKKASKI